MSESIVQAQTRRNNADRDRTSCFKSYNELREDIKRMQKRIKKSEDDARQSIDCLPTKYHKYGSGQTLSEMFHSLDQELMKFDQMSYLEVNRIIDRIKVLGSI